MGSMSLCASGQQGQAPAGNNDPYRGIIAAQLGFTRNGNRVMQAQWMHRPDQAAGQPNPVTVRTVAIQPGGTLAQAQAHAAAALNAPMPVLPSTHVNNQS